MPEEITYRVARPEDAEQILKIYAPFVEHTTVTFEYTVPTAAEFQERIRRTLVNYPYLVAEAGGEVVGYAYAGPFRERAAYIWSAEVSVYVRPDMHRRSIGRTLYTMLEEILRRQNVASMAACISRPNRESVKFHSCLDFERVARFTKCAFKLGRWVDIVYMQKILREDDGEPEAFIPYSRLDR